VPIAGSVATVAGLRLTAESLAGRRNRIGTVTVERIEPAGRDGAPQDRAAATAPGEQAEDGAQRPGPAPDGMAGSRLGGNGPAGGAGH
jgi:hypothetical protein